MLVFRLKKPFIDIGEEEILSLFKKEIIKKKTLDNFFLCSLKDYKKYKKTKNLEKKISKILAKRLGFCHEIYELILIADKKKFLEKLKKTNFLEYYKKDFCVRYKGFFYKEKEIADIVYKNLNYNLKKKINKINKKNQKIKCKINQITVNLNNPKTKFVFYEIEDKILCLLFLNEADKTYNDRKAHLRPGFHPTSLSPELARACINLTGLKKGIIFDPFCGTSGILIEAALMEFYVIGN
ncbi:MAG: DNA methyltransferase, partial [Candidatus Woesearchaeota archaeon]